MANIIVLGDSWSSSQFSSGCNDWIDYYPADLSVANQLRALGHRVYELANPGDSMLGQMGRLNQMAIDNRNDTMSWDTSVDWIIAGWTEWTRDTALIKHAQLPPQTHPSLGRSYSDMFAHTRFRMKTALFNYTSAYPHARWLHWGGLSRVWVDAFPKQHTVLYWDYLHEVHNWYPAGVQDLRSYGPRSTNVQDIKKYVLQVFPGTPHTHAETIAQDLLGWYRCDGTDIMPDRGHPRFEHYRQLVTAIHNYILEQPVIKPETNKEVFNIFKSKKKKKNRQ